MLISSTRLPHRLTRNAFSSIDLPHQWDVRFHMINLATRSERLLSKSVTRQCRDFSRLRRIEDPQLRRQVFTTETRSKYQLCQAFAEERIRNGNIILLPPSLKKKYPNLYPTNIAFGPKSDEKQNIEVPESMIESLTAPYNNRRLEMLGDALIEMIITEDLITKYDCIPIEELIKIRSLLVRNEHFKKISFYIYNLRDSLDFAASSGVDVDRVLSKDTPYSKLYDSYHKKPGAIDADLFEAYVGGLFLDIVKTSNWETAMNYLREWLSELSAPILEEYNIGKLNEENLISVANYITNEDIKEFSSKFEYASKTINDSFQYLPEKYSKKGIYFPQIDSQSLNTRMLLFPKQAAMLLPDELNKIFIKGVSSRGGKEKVIILRKFILNFHNDYLLFFGRSLLKFLLVRFYYNKYPTMSVERLSQGVMSSISNIPDVEKSYFPDLMMILESIKVDLPLYMFKSIDIWKESVPSVYWGALFKSYLATLYISEKEKTGVAFALQETERFLFQKSDDNKQLAFIKTPKENDTSRWNGAKKVYRKYMANFSGPEHSLDPLDFPKDGLKSQIWLDNMIVQLQKGNVQDVLSELEQEKMEEEEKYQTPPFLNRNVTGIDPYPLSCDQLLFVCKEVLKDIEPEYLVQNRTENQEFTVECKIGNVEVGRGTARNLDDAKLLSAEAAITSQRFLIKALKEHIPGNSQMADFTLNFLNRYHNKRLQERDIISSNHPSKPQCSIPVKKSFKTTGSLISKIKLVDYVKNELNGLHFPSYKLLSQGSSSLFTVACTIRGITIGIGIGKEVEIAENHAADAALQSPALLNWVISCSKGPETVNALGHMKACKTVFNLIEKIGKSQSSSRMERLEYTELCNYSKLPIEYEMEVDDNLAGTVSFQKLDNSAILSPFFTLASIPETSQHQHVKPPVDKSPVPPSNANNVNSSSHVTTLRDHISKLYNGIPILSTCKKDSFRYSRSLLLAAFGRALNPEQNCKLPISFKPICNKNGGLGENLKTKAAVCFVGQDAISAGEGPSMDEAMDAASEAALQYPSLLLEAIKKVKPQMGLTSTSHWPSELLEINPVCSNKAPKLAAKSKMESGSLKKMGKKGKKGMKT